ncbi:MAG TPA: lipopolysaccharide heptosyltransferase II [Verrucomicrobiae bacterium]|nr:lipopolysaccharide heptosyltransferase II [Verrucomicrobiae bacterium]
MRVLSPTPNSQLPASILVRGVNWLGDAVMTTPALMRLRERFPDARIVILTPEKLAELWRNHPAVNEIISIAPGEGLFSVSRKLRSGKFDLALVFPNSPRSAMEPWLARIPQRIGYSRPWRNFFLTKTVAARAEYFPMRKLSEEAIRLLIENSRANTKFNPPPKAHHIFEYLHLAGALGANPEPLPPRLFVEEKEIRDAAIRFNLNSENRPIFALNPGAEYGPAKRWPAEKFIAVAKEIQRQTNCAWILLGGKNDLPIANQIESGLQNSKFKIQNCCGKTSLRELMALLKCCRALLTNDTGPMHVAAALETPVVALFGSTSPELTGPGLPGDSRNQWLKSDAPCSPCFLRECPIDFRCMTEIPVERVVNAVLKTARTN